jgi:phage terminase large subunit
MGSERPLRVLCARELMKSVQESVHETLSLQIERLGLKPFYKIEKSGIYGRNGTQFKFSGLRDTQNLKSYENFDVWFVEEAANVSHRSWEYIIPTIRKSGAELWVAFNPELDTDETYRRWVLNPPPGAVVVKTSYHDNNWLTKELLDKIEHSRLTDPDGFLNIYEGHCRTSLEGAIYVDEIRAATQANHITRVPYNPAFPVHTFWDLGFADQTAIWFVQSIAFEHRFIDFYRNNRKALAHYLAELQGRGYVYGTHHLPHDGRAHGLATGKSIEEMMRAAGLRVKIVPDIGVKNGINAVRTLFPLSWFDEEKTKDGLDALRRYRYEVDPITQQFSKLPFHDDNSNPADAYRMAGVGLTEPIREKEKKTRERARPRSAWS